jgi:glycosyltransferase involved in cell wall biosynthesis
LEILALFVVCLLQGRQDAVLTPRATPCGNVAAALSRAWGCGVFLQMTGDEIFPGRWGNRTLHLLRGAMDGAHRIHVPSVLFAEALRRIHPPAAGRVHGAAPWVPLSGLASEPIDQSVFANLPKDAFVVVAPTRLVHWRGVDTLLLAMADLRNSGDSVHLVVLGDGPQREELEAMAETLFLRRRDVPGGVDLVTFIGETLAVQTWMERADAVAFAARTHPETARAEGTALIALEAALLGKPLILGRAGAAAEHFQDGETALLIQPATDPAAYADGIRRLIREPELREKLGRQARATISQVLNPSAQSRAMATILSEIRQNRTDQ